MTAVDETPLESVRNHKSQSGRRMTSGVEQAELASTAAEAGVELPRLVFFTATSSGECRRVESWVAHVMQSRRNYRRVKLVMVDSEARPDLVARFGVTRLPTFVVVERKVAKGRLECPRGIQEIAALLAPWLQADHPPVPG